jgi:hypothetical protein
MSWILIINLHNAASSYFEARKFVPVDSPFQNLPIKNGKHHGCGDTGGPAILNQKQNQSVKETNLVGLEGFQQSEKKGGGDCSGQCDCRK